MNDELKSKSLEILTSLSDTVKEGANFTLAQLPGLAQEYVLYGRVSSLAGLLLGLIFMFIAYKLSKSIDFENDGHLEPFKFIASLISGVAGLVLTLAGLHTAILVWTAPKIWLIQELVKLVK